MNTPTANSTNQKTDLQIGGFEPDAFSDYEGEHSLMLFYSGCNLRCKYCHNKELWKPRSAKYSFLSVIAKNLNSLHSAVIFCGGEPTIHSNLPMQIYYCKSLGKKTKLYTNGQNPELTKDCLLAGLNAISLDLKCVNESHIVGEESVYIDNLDTILSFASNFRHLDIDIRTTIWEDCPSTEKSAIVSRMSALKKKFCKSKINIYIQLERKCK